LIIKEEVMEDVQLAMEDIQLIMEGPSITISVRLSLYQTLSQNGLLRRH